MTKICVMYERTVQSVHVDPADLCDEKILKIIEPIKMKKTDFYGRNAIAIFLFWVQRRLFNNSIWIF